MTDEHWMRRAIELGRQAEALGEVPVGAILVRDNQVIGSGYNSPLGCHDPTAHAEVKALRDAAQATGNYRLPGSTLYVTIEPCAMCAGALVHARVARLVFGAREPRAGVVASNILLLDQGFLNHKVVWEGGVLEDECASQMRSFFRARR